MITNEKKDDTLFVTTINSYLNDHADEEQILIDFCERAQLTGEEIHNLVNVVKNIVVDCIFPMLTDKIAAVVNEDEVFGHE